MPALRSNFNPLFLCRRFGKKVSRALSGRSMKIVLEHFHYSGPYWAISALRDFFMTCQKACDESGKSSGGERETRCSFGNEVIWFGACVVEKYAKNESEQKNPMDQNSYSDELWLECYKQTHKVPSWLAGLCWTVWKKKKKKKTDRHARKSQINLWLTRKQCTDAMAVQSHTA